MQTAKYRQFVMTDKTKMAELNHRTPTKFAHTGL